MNTGLLSLDLTISLTEDITRADTPILKGAALLYSRIACWNGPAFVESLAEEVSSGLTARERKAAHKLLVATGDIDSSLNSFRASDVLRELNQLPDARPGINMDALMTLAHAYIKSRQNHVANSMYLALKLRIPFHATPGEAAEVAPLFELPRCGEVSEQGPLEVSLPDIDALAWNDVFELRQSPYLPQYRDFLSDFHLRPDADVAIVEEINESLWDVIGQLKPSKSGSAIKRVVANIPVPIIPIPNPYAAYKDYKEGSKERHMYLDYGWLWFIQEARAKADRP